MLLQVMSLLEEQTIMLSEDQEWLTTLQQEEIFKMEKVDRLRLVRLLSLCTILFFLLLHSGGKDLRLPLTLALILLSRMPWSTR